MHIYRKNAVNLEKYSLCAQNKNVVKECSLLIINQTYIKVFRLTISPKSAASNSLKTLSAAIWKIKEMKYNLLFHTIIPVTVKFCY